MPKFIVTKPPKKAKSYVVATRPCVVTRPFYSKNEQIFLEGIQSGTTSVFRGRTVKHCDLNGSVGNIYNKPEWDKNRKKWTYVVNVLLQYDDLYVKVNENRIGGKLWPACDCFNSYCTHYQYYLKYQTIMDKRETTLKDATKQDSEITFQVERLE